MRRRGTNRPEILRGSEDEDLIQAYRGDDIVYGLGGNDRLYGGHDDDQIHGDAGNDNLYGEEGRDRLYGGAHRDRLSGGSGSDVLDGGSGNDFMVGGTGDDRYVVDSDGDSIHEAFNEGFDTVYASITVDLARWSEVEHLTLTGAEPIAALGNAQHNTLVGNEGANLLNGRTGDDVMMGRQGDDRYYVDSQGDRPVELAGEGFDVVHAQASYVLLGVQDIEYLGAAIGSDTTPISLIGNAIDNTVVGNAGDNLIGGGGGNDTLHGLKGRDTFYFLGTPGPDTADRIADFVALDDTIRLAQVSFKSLQLGQLGTSAFKDLGLAGARVDADDRIFYDRRTGEISFDADGSGAMTAVQIATLDNRAILSAADFLVT